MAGIADFRLPIADGHWEELPHQFFNRQSAIVNRLLRGITAADSTPE
jgi:hypothetical protein